MDESCALVVPEINIDDIKSKRRLVANPNCSTIQSVLALKPLEDAFKITRINYSTYQAVSGSGKKGLNDWEGAEKGQPTGFYPYDISRTCIPEIDVFFDDGYSKEEKKMIEETRKILHRPDLKISATCIRVPVPVAHGVMMEVEFEKPVTPEEARKVLAAYPVDNGLLIYCVADNVRKGAASNAVQIVKKLIEEHEELMAYNEKK